MGALSTILIVLGILMLLEGSSIFIFPKFALKMFRKFMKSAEKHLKVWGIGEIIIAIILIIIGIKL